jgi:hypothetical protein
MSRQAEVIKSWLALESWRYGHHYGGDNAMTSIACCIANRYRKGWGSWHEILRDIPMYSALALEDIPIGYPNPNDPSFVRLLVNVDKIFDNQFDDKRNGSNEGVFFGDLAKITRPWFLENIVRNPTEHQCVCNISTLSFWK